MDVTKRPPVAAWLFGTVSSGSVSNSLQQGRGQVPEPRPHLYHVRQELGDEDGERVPLKLVVRRHVLHEAHRRDEGRDAVLVSRDEARRALARFRVLWELESMPIDSIRASSSVRSAQPHGRSGFPSNWVTVELKPVRPPAKRVCRLSRFKLRECSAQLRRKGSLRRCANLGGETAPRDSLRRGRRPPP